MADLAHAALTLTSASTVDDVLAVVTDAAAMIVGAHQAVSSRLVRGWEDASTYVGLSERYERYRDYDEVPKGLGVLNAVTRENKPLRLTPDELRAHPEFRGLRDAPGHPPLPNYLAAPLIARDGSNLGLIQLSHKVDESDFTAEDEAVIVQLAQMASSAIESIELLAREKAARVRAEALQRVGAAITARLELQEIVQLATDAATELTPAQFGSFFYNVVSASGEAYMLYTLSGVPASAFAGFPMPRNTQVFAPTFGGEGTVRVDDITADERYGKNEPHRGMPRGHLPVRSYLAVPVCLSDGSVAGGLFFGHPDPAVFGPEDEELVEGIASHASIAIENARLYDDRVRTAQMLQQALLPPELPEIPDIQLATSYRAAGQGAEVGGDFYDAFSLPDGSWAFVVGDVCGKGPPAAATTALARYTLRAHAVSESDPVTLLTLLNDALLHQRASGFCTVGFARVRPGAGRVGVELVLAGHPRAIVVRASGSHELLGEVGTPVGLLDSPELSAVETELGPGDLLVLYTDGLGEAAAPERILSEDELAAHASRAAGDGVTAVVEQLERTAVELAAGSPRDDIAILALRPAAPTRTVAEFTRRLTSGADAAHEVAAALEPLEPQLGSELVADLRLLATELVANAVRHSNSNTRPIELHVRAGSDVVRLSVESDGTGFELPPRPVALPHGPGGWGLYLVDQRAARWGVETVDGTRVWVEVPVT
jgi:serine phosphatase RsbU (regulator of sigma subunit)/anti-sigma regulatory factor (Ser/Thr protein kinase)